MSYLLIRLRKAMDACASPDSSLSALALEVPRQVDEVDCLEPWEQLSMDGRYLEAGHRWRLHQFLEVRSLNRKLLASVLLMMEELS